MPETISLNDSSMNENLSSLNPAETNDSRMEGMGWLLPLFLLVLILGLVLYFMNGSGNYKPAIAWQFISYSDTDTVVTKPIIIKTDSVTKQEVQLQLTDTTITVAKGGIEYRLALFISSNRAEDSIDKNRWFEFEDPTFDDNAAIPAESLLQQIQNLATILKKYPRIKIRIGCYANDAQNSAANLELSKSRANAVTAELQKFAVKQMQIVSAEGFGTRGTRAGAAEVRIKRTSVMINVVAK